MYRISSYYPGETNVKRVYYQDIKTYEEAILLLNQVKDSVTQVGCQVSEIQNDIFSCININTKNDNKYT